MISKPSETTRIATWIDSLQQQTLALNKKKYTPNFNIDITLISNYLSTVPENSPRYKSTNNEAKNTKYDFKHRRSLVPLLLNWIRYLTHLNLKPIQKL